MATLRRSVVTATLKRGHLDEVFVQVNGTSSAHGARRRCGSARRGVWELGLCATFEIPFCLGSFLKPLANDCNLAISGPCDALREVCKGSTIRIAGTALRRARVLGSSSVVV
jgi:hypothetical protein